MIGAVLSITAASVKGFYQVAALSQKGVAAAQAKTPTTTTTTKT